LTNFGGGTAERLPPASLGAAAAAAARSALDDGVGAAEEAGDGGVSASLAGVPCVAAEGGSAGGEETGSSLPQPANKTLAQAVARNQARKSNVIRSILQTANRRVSCCGTIRYRNAFLESLESQGSIDRYR
jgi:hypothetical protein